MNHLKSFCLIFVILSVNVSCAQSNSIVGIWQESEFIIDNVDCNLDTTNLVFSDWKYKFYSDGTFEKNSFFICNGDSIQIRGKWEFRNNTIFLKTKGKCEIGEIPDDYIESIVWISPDLWYVCLVSESEKNKAIAIVAYRKID